MEISSFVERIGRSLLSVLLLAATVQACNADLQYSTLQGNGTPSIAVTGVGVLQSVSGPMRDFGTVDPVSESSLSQQFIVKNVGPSPFVIKELIPSCECTTAAIGLVGASSLPPALPCTIAPSSDACITVTISLKGDSPGSFVKTVQVVAESPNPEKPTLLTMRFVIPALIEFSPPVTEFEDIVEGQSKTIALTVAADSRLLAGPLPELLSSSPYVTATPGPKIRSGEPGVAKPVMKALVYDVTLSDQAPIGPFTATLYFAQMSNPAQTDPPLSSANTSPWLGVRGLVIGQVTGDAQADPPSVNFGSVKFGVGSTFVVKLFGSQNALAGARAETPASWLTMRLGDLVAAPSGSDVAGHSPYERDLSLSIGPACPLGLLRSEVRVDLDPGHRIELQVSGYCPTSEFLQGSHL